MSASTPHEASRQAGILDTIWAIYTELVPDDGDQETVEIPGIRLVGGSSRLDSINLVNLLLDVEQKVSGRFGVPISLMDERAMSENRSPFRTIQTLAEFIGTLIDESNE